MVKLRNRRLVGKRLLKEGEQASLHLSEFSQGKPNELSLNVLENKLLDDDSYKEINRRRRNRVLRRIGIITGAVCMAAFLVWLASSYIERVQEERTSNVGLLKTSLAYLEQTDATLAQMDAFFQTGFNDSTLSVAQKLQNNIPAAQEMLEPARSYAQQAENVLDNSTADKEAAEHALNSIAARETMFEIGQKRLAEDIGAKQAYDALVVAQNQITEANALLSESAKIIVDTTEQNIAQSTEYATSAQKLFTQAKENIAVASQSYVKADVSSMATYVDKRLEAADAALASNAAAALQDKKTAETKNETYNKLDSEAAELATRLPATFTQPVVDAYKNATSILIENYNAARGDAGRNDASLREYLGVDTKA